MTVPPHDEPVFEPEITAILSQAVDQTCDVFHIAADNSQDRRVVAARIADLARTGLIDAAALRDRILRESRSTI